MIVASVKENSNLRTARHVPSYVPLRGL